MTRRVGWVCGAGEVNWEGERGRGRRERQREGERQGKRARGRGEREEGRGRKKTGGRKAVKKEERLSLGRKPFKGVCKGGQDWMEFKTGRPV
ncbi:hypothetical protein IE53DRAFT_99061 [Violaceomyces palustris]|uniref:Uncharacterized protein n=2 Tax=Violaceomyces palustris TaxID=1673888 RepID=A0ACD0NSN4_9BASI|nr:hypothetical protein IE53DRAFT_179584 [Violaceomyces palustris]PWN50366.1 hypothetical protein IE53DRAFT_99061 [Violaceomyces palustris]